MLRKAKLQPKILVSYKQSHGSMNKTNLAIWIAKTQTNHFVGIQIKLLSVRPDFLQGWGDIPTAILSVAWKMRTKWSSY